MRALVRLLIAAAQVGMSACADSPPGGGGPDAAGADRLEAAQPAGAPREGEPQVVDISLLGSNQGSPEAPVRVIEFSDYGCGYCRKFHQETWPTLVREFVDAGKVEWKFLPYVSGMFENSTAATVAAECALEQGDAPFRTMNSLIWEHQAEWKRAADPAPVLRGLAGEARVDVMRYDSCIAEGRRARRVDAATLLAQQNGVRATPTFFVVGYPPLQGALPTEVFVQVLNMVYEEVTKSGGSR
jgi:protein-disulfide isomerase